MTFRIHHGDALEVLRAMPEGLARCCVTSPPYWGLRDYQHPEQIGLEQTPEEYVARLVEVLHEVRRVLTDDGTLWLNLGDSYATGGGRVGEAPGGGKQGEAWRIRGLMTTPNRLPIPGLKPKDLVGIPWRVAFALQADGWWLRSDIVWSKPNPTPESVTDRPTKAHEYVFLLAKSERYYYDAAAIMEPVAGNFLPNHHRNVFDNGPEPPPGQPPHTGLRRYGSANAIKQRERNRGGRTDGFVQSPPWDGTRETRNRRTVWTITTQPFAEAHFAVMPEALVKPCVLAGSAPGDVVLDPFAGSGAVGVVALRHGRRFVGIELNAEYVEMARRRIGGPLFAEGV